MPSCTPHTIKLASLFNNHCNSKDTKKPMAPPVGMPGEV